MSIAIYLINISISKYTIFKSVGSAGKREEVAKLIWGASRMFRTLLQREFLIFLDYTEEPDILHLEGITIYYQGGDKDIPNLFCPAAFDRPLMVYYSDLKDNE